MTNKTDNAIWGKFKRRAEELRKISEAIREVKDDEKEKIFKERAEKLSQGKDYFIGDKDILKIISFYVAGEYYGIEVKYLQEVYEVNTITNVPCTPSVLEGLINHRGSVLTIINLRVLFDLQDNNILKQEQFNINSDKVNTDFFYKVLVLNCSGIKAGIIIDRYDRLMELPIESIQEVSSFFHDKNKIVKSEININNLPLLIIDPEELLNDKRLIINEDI